MKEIIKCFNAAFIMAIVLEGQGFDCIAEVLRKLCHVIEHVKSGRVLLTIRDCFNIDAAVIRHGLWHQHGLAITRLMPRDIAAPRPGAYTLHLH